MSAITPMIVSPTTKRRRYVRGYHSLLESVTWAGGGGSLDLFWSALRFKVKLLLLSLLLMLTLPRSVYDLGFVVYSFLSLKCVEQGFWALRIVTINIIIIIIICFITFPCFCAQTERFLFTWTQTKFSFTSCTFVLCLSSWCKLLAVVLSNVSIEPL